jgi:hypothetical protein
MCEVSYTIQLRISSFPVLFKNLKINISFISVTVSVVVYGCEAWTLH